MLSSSYKKWITKEKFLICIRLSLSFTSLSLFLLLPFFTLIHLCKRFQSCCTCLIPEQHRPHQAELSFLGSLCSVRKLKSKYFRTKCNNNKKFNFYYYIFAGFCDLECTILSVTTMSCQNIYCRQTSCIRCRFRHCRTDT